ncbi:MAG: NAD-dependent epimerase/dehydratase family protein [Clostridiales bacterium]|nr:NAD-dependent epimerase/dehydratase family protein [Clostridiales bacterium]
MNQKRILLTGSTGSMGKESFKQLYEYKFKFHIVLLIRPSKKNIKMMKKYKNDPAVTIIWGDLTDYDDVLKAVSLSDVILHVAALVSPAADKHPDLAWKINYGGTENIVKAIKSQPNPDLIKLVYIGTIAETGNRSVPVHWGRIGDPIVPSLYDYYAVSKIAAERLVIESALKNWVSLRQTGILHLDILGVDDGISYHQPINNHLEWVTAHDSGKLMVACCSDDLPQDFWRNVYNIGGGSTCRLRSYEFTKTLYQMLGVEYEQLADPNWYATRNFHGHWYLDSDRLDDITHFRSESFEDFLVQLEKAIPFSMKLLKYMPLNYVKEKVMKKTPMSKNGPLYWIENNIENKINAFFGSREKWENIPGWDKFKLIDDTNYIILNHGYDETKSDESLDIHEMNKAAIFRGGKCLSKTMITGDLTTKLKWRCAYGHKFEASPLLVLKAGHWCNVCSAPKWNYDEIAKTNPFISQVWHADHEKEKNNTY